MIDMQRILDVLRRLETGEPLTDTERACAVSFKASVTAHETYKTAEIGVATASKVFTAAQIAFGLKKTINNAGIEITKVAEVFDSIEQA